MDSNNADEVGPVKKAKETWRQFEDLALAQRLQDEEFNNHFDNNRSERRLIQGDIRVSKAEQRSEDEFAAQRFERVRRERELEDERVAMEVHRKLQTEEADSKRSREMHDEMLARRMQEMEVSRTKGNNGHHHHYHHNEANRASLPSWDQREFRESVTSTSNSRAGCSSSGPQAGGGTFHNQPPLLHQHQQNGQQHGAGSFKKQPPPRPPPPRQNSFK